MSYRMRRAWVQAPQGRTELIEVHVRQRADAARLVLEHLVYMSADAQGLRDTKAGHAAMNWANKWKGQALKAEYTLGDQTISVEKSKC